MKVKGILRGQTIELTEAIGLPDGTELDLEIELLEASDDQPLTSFIGAARGSFATSEEADQFIRQERDSWES